MSIIKFKKHAGIVLFLMIILYATFNGDDFQLSQNEQQAYLIKTSWWGLVSKEIPLRWVEKSGYGYPCWMAKSKNGEWYCVVNEIP